MYSIRPYQAYSFRCWFSNNSILAFDVSVLSQDLVSLCSFHLILSFLPEPLWCCSLQPIFRSCQDHVWFVLILFNRSVVSFAQALSFHSFVYRSSSWRLYMMVHQGFNSFSKCSSRFFSKKLKLSSYCNPECISVYRIIGGGIMSFLIIWVHVSWFTCC